MRPCYSRYFRIFFYFLFLAGHDQYLIMFKDSNVFEFTNFQFKTKYNNTEIILLIEIICSLAENKKKQSLKQFSD